MCQSHGKRKIQQQQEGDREKGRVHKHTAFPAFLWLSWLWGAKGPRAQTLPKEPAAAGGVTVENEPGCALGVAGRSAAQSQGEGSGSYGSAPPSIVRAGPQIHGGSHSNAPGLAGPKAQRLSAITWKVDVGRWARLAAATGIKAAIL